ncbi:Imidazolonepropionase [Nannocystis exedens]|uniref:Imidazolonepropionase n=1 Tax=Nannocystis exedens TaxID=54 RepID=A0A1I1ZRU4_9BACT|nr:amidohydrolase family protein [Nannocystis exedens]PCC75348.1 imidazolonepropionase [Nannocystis exedens]SFE34355.1 Imidazolonepropionase [Nannocystis exedens]
MHSTPRPVTDSYSFTTSAVRLRSRMHSLHRITRCASLGCWIVAIAGCDGGGATSTAGTTEHGTSDGSTAAATSAPESTGGPDTSTTAITSETDPTAGSTSDGSASEASTSEVGTNGTTEDTTAASATTESATTESTSEHSTSEASTTEASTTEASTTEASTTEASTTEASTTEGCESGSRAVKLARLIDPADGSVLEPAIVIVHEDRIVAVETDEAEIPCGAEVIDWSGYTGVPGLVDAHTHFIYQTDDEPGTFPWQRSWWLFQNSPETLAELARQAAEKTVKLGVTTAIDKGCGPGDYLVAELRDAIAAGEVPGPRIYTAGYGISGPVPSIEVMKGWIQQNVADGADLIKVWADDCSDDKLVCSSKFSFEQLKAAVDEAHALGRPIAIHAYHADTAKLAIMAGPDSLEHPEGLDTIDFMDMMAMGVTYVPTIDHNRYYRDNIAYFGYDPGKAAEFEAYIALNLATANQAYLAGVDIAMGSDAVFSGFGENTRELEQFIQAGMTPLAALRAATIEGAASIGVEHEVGRVAVGYFADIVAVDGDPLADTSVLIGNIHGVMKSGVVVQ